MGITDMKIYKHKKVLKVYEICIFWRAFKKKFLGNSLAVQWLGLCASTAGGKGSIPSGGTKIPHATGQKINK